MAARAIQLSALLLATIGTAAAAEPPAEPAPPGLTLAYESPDWLILRGAPIPGGELRARYLEAYCRGNSADADWTKHTVIPHTSELVSISGDKKRLRLRDQLADGVIVEHEIIARDDETEFALTARNPTAKASEAQWAQSCVRLGRFTGFEREGGNLDDYLPKCFIFLEGKLARMSEIQPWAKQARYIPGQVWPAPGVPRADANPRPMSALAPSNGLIGAFSADEKTLFATAWEPYQELFQGVARCLHADMRIGGLAPGETKRIRGKIYILPNDVPALLARYAGDFPRHAGRKD